MRSLLGAKEEKITKKGITNIIKDILKKYNLPCELPPRINREELIKTIKIDKKSKGEYINIILLKDIGEGIIKKVDKEEIVRFV